MGTKEEIGANIRLMRKSRKMTQADLAKAIGQSASSITMYETGRREPDFETLEALADIFNVPLVTLIPVEEYESEAPATPEARVLAKGMDRMPEAQRKAIMTMMEGLYPGFFKEGMKNDDT